MYIEDQKSIVVISLPKIVVQTKDASDFIQAINKFYCATLDTLIEQYGRNQIEYDNRYCADSFVPVVRDVNYTNILDKHPDVIQIDKYVKLEKDDDKYPDSEELLKLWKGEE